MKLGDIVAFVMNVNVFQLKKLSVNHWPHKIKCCSYLDCNHNFDDDIDDAGDDGVSKIEMQGAKAELKQKQLTFEKQGYCAVT